MNAVFAQYQDLPKELYILAVARVVAAAGAFVMPMMTLILTQKMGLSVAHAGMLVSLASASYIPGSLLGGKLADAKGRKVVLVSAEIVCGICWVICGFFPESVYVIPFIFVANFCWGAIDPTATALTTDLTSPNQRKAAFSLSYLGHNIGYAVGPLLAGFLFLNHAHWMFWGDGITTIAAAILILVFVKESKPKDESDAHTQHEETVEGSVWPILWQRRYLLWFTAANFLLAFSYAQVTFTLPLQLNEIFGDNGARNFGFLMTINAITVVLFTSVMIALTRKWHSIFVVALTGILYFFGFGMIYWASVLVVFFISTIVWTLGETMHHINANAYIASHSPQSHRGRINSILPIIYGMGYGLAPLIMGQFIEQNSVRESWLLVMVMAGAGTLCMLALGSGDIKREQRKLAIANAQRNI